MLHTLAALMPFAPGDPTTPAPPIPATAPPAPVPSPAATSHGWSSGRGITSQTIQDGGFGDALRNVQVPSGVLALIGLLVVVLVVVAAYVLIWHTANARNKGALKQNAEGSGAVLIPLLTAGAIIYGVNRIFGVGDWVTRTFLS